jgi:hypothetical protein
VTLRGSDAPRLWTPPLRTLTPETSIGFEQVAFARDVIGHPFDPWQKFAVIHAGELLPDGRPRFRLVLIIVARQNGKTEIPVVLSLHWLFVDEWPLVLGTSTKLDYAKESWAKAVKIMKRCRPLRARVPRRGGVKTVNGGVELTTENDCRYKIAPANDEGGRSLTIDRLVMDELRQHHSYEAWAAAEPAVSARPLGQIWAMSNAGDDKSIVLNEKRDEALAFIAWWDEHGTEQVAADLLAGYRPPGMPDFRVGIFEWSAPEDFDPDAPDDVIMRHLLAANPNAGHPLHGADPDELLASYHAAKRKGGEAWTTYKTERMCIRVLSANPAIDGAAWRRNVAAVDLADRPMAWFVDVSPDLQHATLCAAVLTGEQREITRVREGVSTTITMPIVAIDPVDAWDGPTAVRQMTGELPGLVARNKPRTLGWLPGGPAAAAAASLRDRTARGRHYPWPPPGVEVVEVAAEASAVCMGFAADVAADLIQHGDDPLISGHVLGADKRLVGAEGQWRFERTGDGHVDGAYAAAGAAHLARTLPPGAPFRPIVTTDDDE